MRRHVLFVTNVHLSTNGNIVSIQFSPTEPKKAKITGEQVKETCDGRECETMAWAWHHVYFFPRFCPKLTTRFVAITPLSDSWDAQANRSCNRLSESLLAKTIAHRVSQTQ